MRMRSSRREPSRNLGSLRNFLPYLKPHTGTILLAVVAILFTSASVLGIGAGLSFMIDHGFHEGNHALLNQAFVMLFGIVLLMGAASYLRVSLTSSVGEKVVARIRQDVFAHALELPPEFYEKTRTGEVLSRIVTDTALLQTVVGGTVAIALRNGLMLIGGITMLLLTSRDLTEYVVFLIPLVVLPIILLGKKVRLLSRTTQDRLADLSAHAHEAVSQVRVVQAYTAEKLECERFGVITGQILDAALKRNRMRALLIGLVITLIFSAIVLVLWIGGQQVVEGNITHGQLSAFVFYSVVVASAVGAISEIIGDLQRAAGAAERLMELLETPSSLATLSENTSTAAPSPEPSIAFEDVTFAYPSRPDTPALQNIQLTVAPGECVALVGPSGAGKTTMLQLLLRFYDASGGTISVGGQNIRTFSLHALRRMMALVPQEPAVFAASVLENIRYGTPDASEAQVEQAARAAAAWEFIQKLPEGLHTSLGERGVKLSGGQRQRIAIARAILRNPSILLLDEATSALDSESEQLVQRGLEQLIQGRTTLVIAHRLSTVQKAHRIAVMEDGRIIDIGSHDALMERCELYRRLATLQLLH